MPHPFVVAQLEQGTPYNETNELTVFGPFATLDAAKAFAATRAESYKAQEEAQHEEHLNLDAEKDGEVVTLADGLELLASWTVTPLLHTV